MSIELIPTSFIGNDTYGDFDWMIDQDTYGDSLFLFNENVESLYNGYQRRGKGNAVIRPYRYCKPSKALPIPTGYIGINKEGWRGGFRKLDLNTKTHIDFAFDLIKDRLQDGDVNRVFYSSNGSNERLGTSIFRVNEDVIDYIMVKLDQLI